MANLAHQLDRGQTLGVLLTLDDRELEHAVIDSVFFNLFVTDRAIVRNGYVTEGATAYAVEPGDVTEVRWLARLLVSERSFTLGKGCELVKLCNEGHFNLPCLFLVFGNFRV